MKPLLRVDDGSTLQELGMASVQIVHDLKNQLNGLKLYATFLRRRIEKNERPDDELQTVMKLISGLDRATNDLSMIVQYARPIELRRQPGFDLQKTIRSICLRLSENAAPVVCDSDSDSIPGNLDPTKLTDALSWISAGAVKFRRSDELLKISVSRHAGNEATIRWSGIATIDHDPFKSFAGSHEIRMSMAARIIEAHGGSVKHDLNIFLANLPLSE